MMGVVPGKREIPTEIESNDDESPKSPRNQVGYVASSHSRVNWIGVHFVAKRWIIAEERQRPTQIRRIIPTQGWKEGSQDTFDRFEQVFHFVKGFIPT